MLLKHQKQEYIYNTLLYLYRKNLHMCTCTVHTYVVQGSTGVCIFLLPAVYVNMAYYSISDIFSVNCNYQYSKKIIGQSWWLSGLTILGHRWPMYTFYSPMITHTAKMLSPFLEILTQIVLHILIANCLQITDLVFSFFQIFQCFSPTKSLGMLPNILDIQGT